jgi:Zn-finger nucleic acid-binding protein
MRLLVACPKCHRQYEATGRPIGKRFRCRCGEIVTISQPQGHDAAVVRCSSCGAPRSEHSAQCKFCGADFTVREQDLDTICPHCFARISDHARFCDHCGTALAAEPLSIEETKLICPACREPHRLHSRLIEGCSISECSTCTGMWLGHATFAELVAHAAAEAVNSDDRVGPRASPHAAPPHPHPAYMPCPVCHELMVRHNYAHRSGVMIHVCKAHGCWFDGDELPRILAWIRSGGLAAANGERQAKAARDADLAERMRINNQFDSPLGGDVDVGSSRSDSTSLSWLADAIQRFFN